jgi:chromosome segregation ATPase
MSHSEGKDDEDLFLKPEEVLSQYSVEWVALRKSYTEAKKELDQVKEKLNELDEKLENGQITEKEHMEEYSRVWKKSTQMVEIKREVESRLFEIQRKIRKANRKLKKLEEEKRRQKRIEKERSNAMIEWMSLKQGFDLVGDKRSEISARMDELELKRRNGEISDEDYRKQHVENLKELAKLRTLEVDIQNRLGELLEIIRK